MKTIIAGIVLTAFVTVACAQERMHVRLSDKQLKPKAAKTQAVTAKDSKGLKTVYDEKLFLLQRDLTQTRSMIYGLNKRPGGKDGC